MLTAVFGGGDAHDLPEGARQVGVVIETALQRYAGHGFIGAGEPLTGRLHPQADQVLAGRRAEALAKGAVKLAGRQARHACQFAAGDRFCRMLVHVFNDLGKSGHGAGAFLDLIDLS